MGPLAEVPPQTIGCLVQKHASKVIILVLPLARTDPQRVQTHSHSPHDHSLQRLSQLSGAVLLVLLIFFVFSNCPLLPFLVSPGLIVVLHLCDHACHASLSYFLGSIHGKPTCESSLLDFGLPGFNHNCTASTESISPLDSHEPVLH